MAATPSTAQELVITGFGGLSIYSDPELRTKETFQQLDYFDLVVDGSIRKVLPAKHYAGAFGFPLFQLLEYRTAINLAGGFLRVIAVDLLGNLWDINGSTITPWCSDLATIMSGGLVNVPYMGQMQGYYIPFVVKTWMARTAFSVNDAVYRYSAVDGNLYVYFVSAIAGTGTSGSVEPKWPATQGSTVVDNAGANQITWTNADILNSQRFQLNYGILIACNYPAMKFVEWKYDPTNVSEAYKVKGTRIGVSMPLDPINVTTAVVTPNINGYGPQTGRAFVWTYYNPNTLHDSSPSPFVGPTKITNLDNSGMQQQLTGSLLPPLPPPTKGFTTYQAYYMEIAVSALTAPYGDGYTAIRCWATKDGGSSFFLLNQLYDDDGDLLTNGDGSIPIATLQAISTANSWTGFVPLPTPQNAVATVRIYDGTNGPINLAPDPLQLGPESWTEIKGTGFITVPNAAPTGDAAFVITGAGSPVSKSIMRSAKISVTPSATYAIQAYIDNSAGTGGTAEWRVLDANSSGTVISLATGSLTQADSTAGNLNATFVGPTKGKVYIEALINGVTITDGSTDIFSDPILELGSSISTTPIVYPTSDFELIYPAPAPLSQQPPPAICLNGVIFENSLLLVDHNDPTRLLYSNTGDLNSYGINSYLQFPTNRSFSIMELIEAYDRLLVTGGREIHQVLSNSPNPGFSRFPFDKQHGSLAYHGSVGYGSGAFALMDAGIAALKIGALIGANSGLEVGFTPEAIISRRIKPLLDSIVPTTIHPDNLAFLSPAAAVDNKQDLYLLACWATPPDLGVDKSLVIMMPMRGTAQGQFSRAISGAIPIANAEIVNLKEVQLPPGNTYAVMALTLQGDVYQLWGGTQDGTLTAVAMTQPLPTAQDIKPELWDTLKVFKLLIMEGDDLPNFQVQAIDDSGTYYPSASTFWTLAQGQHTIKLGGIKSRQLTLRFQHSAATTNTPMLSMLKLKYDIEGLTP